MSEVIREGDRVCLMKDEQVVAECRIDRATRQGSVTRYADFSDAVDEGAGDPLELYLQSNEEDFREHGLVCSFCQKPSHKVGTLIAGAEAYICDECISLCVDIIAEQSS